MTDQKLNDVSQSGVREGTDLQKGEMLEIFSKDSVFVTHFYFTPMGRNVRLAAVERSPDDPEVMRCKCSMVMSIEAFLGLCQLGDHVKSQLINMQKPTGIDTNEGEGQKWG